MQGKDIANRLKEVLPKYTDEFSDITSITSLSRVSTTITAVTASAHGLTTGGYITIRGAKDPVTITSITRVDKVVTVTTTTNHKLSDPSLYSPEQAALLTVTISGAVPAGYNGTFKLLSVPTTTTFTYQIATTPTTPATTGGFLLQDDFDGYNGYKQVTVTNTTTFTYTTTDTNLNTPAQGTIEMSNATRIGWAATAERASQFYSEDKSRVLKNWIFAVVGPRIAYKDNTVATDLSTAIKSNESYYYDRQQDLSLYLFLPSQNDVLGGTASDLARTLEKPIFKSIVNFQFSSELCDEKYQPVSYTGDEADDYNTAIYVHRYDFLSQGEIQNADTVDINPGTPLLLVDGSIKDKGMTYKPKTR